MSQADERIVMPADGAYGTVEVPAAPKKKGSLKRLVASSAAISLALGFAAVTAVDHGLMSFSSEPYVQVPRVLLARLGLRPEIRALWAGQLLCRKISSSSTRAAGIPNATIEVNGRRSHRSSPRVGAIRT